MRKVPTIFERDWQGDRRVLDVPHPACAWVFEGEGIATRKLDGTCCMIDDGKLYRRRELRGELAEDGQSVWFATDQYPGFIPIESDLQAKTIFGWMPVDDGPEDKWHRDAIARWPDLPNGTYELLGPKVQGGRERDIWIGYGHHVLIGHSEECLKVLESGGVYRAWGVVGEVPRTFEGLKAYFPSRDIEGIVFQHPDGRMGKIKARDFGIARGKNG